MMNKQEIIRFRIKGKDKTIINNDDASKIKKIVFIYGKACEEIKKKIFKKMERKCKIYNKFKRETIFFTQKANHFFR